MPLIKRYPNRKLYDTEARRYITLEEIAELVQRGAEVQVLDHASGADLTALTLSQIVFELQKKQRGIFPHSLLATLIHNSAQHLSSTPFLGELVDAEIQRRIETLVASGELNVEEGSLWLEKLANAAPEAGSQPHFRTPLEITTEQISETLQRLPILTRKDTLRLQEQLEQLEASLDQIQNQKPTDPDSPATLT